jgi:long-chain acyl-CoA synthetase
MEPLTDIRSINKLYEKLSTSSGHLETYIDGSESRISFAQVSLDVDHVIGLFLELQLQPEQRVGIIAANSYEWVVCDFAMLACGLVSVPLDPEIEHDLNEFRTKFDLKLIFVDEDIQRSQAREDVHIIQELLKGEKYSIDGFEPYQFLPDAPLSFKFTSGSTERPKSLLTKKKSVDAGLREVQALFHHGSTDKIMVFLPLHTYQQRYWVYSAVLFDHDVLIVPKLFALIAAMRGKPTVIMGVPYFFEMVEKLLIDRWEEDHVTSLEHQGDELQQILGGNIRYLWTGSAPISRATASFYQDRNMAIYQGYGMNEVCIVTKNYEGHNRLGSVGKLLPGKEISFDKNGQILVHSEYEIADQYYQGTPEDNTATFVGKGIVATGDLGHFDDDGYLYIIGRLKELIVLSNAQKIFPTPIEKLLEKSALIEQCMVYGDRQPHVVALLVTADKGTSKTQIQEVINTVNSELSPVQQIRNFRVIDTPFNTKNGQLTNLHKLKRKNITERHYSTIQQMYQ